jgi:hypothetical protein
MYSVEILSEVIDSFIICIDVCVNLIFPKSHCPFNGPNGTYVTKPNVTRHSLVCDKVVLIPKPKSTRLVGIDVLLRQIIAACPLHSDASSGRITRERVFGVLSACF